MDAADVGANAEANVTAEVAAEIATDVAAQAVAEGAVDIVTVVASRTSTGSSCREVDSPSWERRRGE
jgi:hypothetical protein